MIKHGLHNCLLSNDQQFYSEETYSDILSGKRALIASLSTFKNFLSHRVKQNRQCGFHLAESVAERMPHFMLYNKKFNKKLKEKLDSMYVKCSLFIHILAIDITLFFRLLDLFERKPFDWKMVNYYSKYEECLVKKTNSQWSQTTNSIQHSWTILSLCDYHYSGIYCTFH